MKLDLDYFEKLWLKDISKNEPDADFWSFRAKEYNHSLNTSEAKLSRVAKVREFLDKGLLNSESIVLDIGCGSGQLAVELAKTAKKVVAIDFSPKMLEFAKKNASDAGLKNLEFVLSDWEQFGSDQKFDFIVASMSPAIQLPIHLNKLLACANGSCYLSSFVERQSDIKQKLSQLIGCEYGTQFNKINFIFNILWTKGIFPELSYELGAHRRTFSLEDANEVYVHELGVTDNQRQINDIRCYLKAMADNGQIIEIIQQRKGELVWTNDNNGFTYKELL